MTYKHRFALALTGCIFLASAGCSNRDGGMPHAGGRAYDRGASGETDKPGSTEKTLNNTPESTSGSGMAPVESNTSARPPVTPTEGASTPVTPPATGSKSNPGKLSGGAGPSGAATVEPEAEPKPKAIDQDKGDADKAKDADKDKASAKK